jgi:4-carboxymuconolactone decarboxylase
MVRKSVIGDRKEEMGRPIAIDVDALDARQRAVHDAILAGPRGVVEGPLRVWLLSPDLADRAQELGAFCRFGTSLPPLLSELAILILGHHWQAGFEWHIHAPIAERAGLHPVVIDEIRRGELPNLVGDAQIVYKFSRQLIEQRYVDDLNYEAAVVALGQRGVVELVGILGYYTLISMTIRAFRIPVPDGAEHPFDRVDEL